MLICFLRNVLFCQHTFAPKYAMKRIKPSIIFICILLLFASALSAQEHVSNQWIDEGYALFNAKKYKEAVVEFTKAIYMDAENEDALLFRGVSYIGLGNYQQALKDINKVLELNPGKRNCI